MHTIEPYYNWRDYYIASEDENSPFFNNNYDEFKFSQKVYNYFIHPQTLALALPGNSVWAW